MGCCFSKKLDKPNPLPNRSTPLQQIDPTKTKTTTQKLETTNKLVIEEKKLEEEVEEEPKKIKEKEEELAVPKKEIFVIRHRKSHERDRTQQHENDTVAVQTRAPPPPTPPPQCSSSSTSSAEEKLTHNNGVVRTSSCTKEEVDAILIQCGRLSRSNSGVKPGKKYSGSKRSFDFDNPEENNTPEADFDDEDDENETRQHRHRHRNRVSVSPQGRRRTPSRERDQQRSGSRERTGSNRRISRSPGRRSENSSNANGGGSSNHSKPGKMVSVPATDKTNGEQSSGNNVKRVSKRAASPSNGSGNGKVSENLQVVGSLSRSSSRKGEQSPYRRNPLSEIDSNKGVASNNGTRVLKKGKETEEHCTVLVQKPNPETSGNSKVTNSKTAIKEQRQETKSHQPIINNNNNITITTVAAEAVKPPTLTRSRSSRKSRDFDATTNTESLPNPSNSYTALLLEDIQNFHQKNAPSFSLPSCVAKACSIMDAVADLNSTTSSNTHENQYQNTNLGVKKIAKDPFVESEVQVTNDLTEPSFHKYVTVRRGGEIEEETEEQESSGSNSFAGSAASHHQHWGNSSTSREPNTADSTDRWSSRSNTKEPNQAPLGIPRLDDSNQTRRAKKRDSDNQKSNGIGRGRVGGSTTSSKGLNATSVVAPS